MAPGPVLDAGLGAWGSPGELGYPSRAVLCAGGAAEGAGRQRLQAPPLGSSSLCPKLLLGVSPGPSPVWEEEEEKGFAGSGWGQGEAGTLLEEKLLWERCRGVSPRVLTQRPALCVAPLLCT